MTHYIALIRKDPDTAFGIEFPDFPGCISTGNTLDELVRGAAEALQLHIEGMLEDGQAIPEPSPLDDIVVDDGAVVTMICPNRNAQPCGTF